MSLRNEKKNYQKTYNKLSDEHKFSKKIIISKNLLQVSVNKNLVKTYNTGKLIASYLVNKYLVKTYNTEKLITSYLMKRNYIPKFFK